MKTKKTLLIIGMLLALAFSSTAQTSGFVYIRDANGPCTPNGYDVTLHVIDMTTGTDYPGSPVFLYNTTSIDAWLPWSGGPNVPDTQTQRWLIRLEVKNNCSGVTIYVTHIPALTSQQYSNGGIYMPVVQF